MASPLFVAKLLDRAKNATGEGLELAERAERTFQVDLAGTGAISADVYVEVSLNGLTWNLMATFALSGNDSITDGFTSAAPWLFTRARAANVTGTDAFVSVLMGY